MYAKYALLGRKLSYLFVYFEIFGPRSRGFLGDTILDLDEPNPTTSWDLQLVFWPEI